MILVTFTSCQSSGKDDVIKDLEDVNSSLMTKNYHLEEDIKVLEVKVDRLKTEMEILKESVEIESANTDIQEIDFDYLLYNLSG